MKSLTTPAGAMPVETSAMLVQSYPTGPWFAGYRLPGLGSIGARAVGVCFEGEGTGDATSTGGTSDSSTTTTDSSKTTTGDTSATDDAADGLGDKGKRALQQERNARQEAEARAAAAEQERDQLREATQSETEKAISAARKEGADEVKAVYQGLIRSAKVEAALSAAGIRPSVMDLASQAPEFAKLKVKDDGTVEGLDEAVAGFKQARKDLFGAATGDGTADGGAGTTKAANPDDLEGLVAAHYEGKA